MEAKNMLRWTSLLISLLILLVNPLEAQKVSPDSGSVYRVNLWLSAGVTAAGVAAINFGRQRNNSKTPLSREEMELVQDPRLNFLDRVALRQNPYRREHFEKVSNQWLIATAALPAVLFLDPHIRRDWLDVTALYLETQAISNTLHTWAPFGPAVFNRLRPQVYYEEIPFEYRRAGTSRNSFYGGHTANAACATFFAAKVLSDYHPEWRGRRWIAYGLAAVPPAIIAIQRIQALRHFPTDNIAGLLVGAATGILIPELHRNTRGRMTLSMIYTDEIRGLGMRWNVR